MGSPARAGFTNPNRKDVFMIRSYRSSIFRLESLESRQLMSVASPTELSEVAQRYARHAGTTNLYLNFDGGTIDDDQAGGRKTIQAYQPNTPFDRNQAIEDIIYRVSEIFSPFDVRVRIIRGAGNYSHGNGDSTIFIGDNAANVDSSGTNYAYASTSFNSSDYPGSTKGYFHRPNGDDYDIGFVDPVFLSSSTSTLFTQNDQQIAQAAAHEAGHTFGLTHVLSSPLNDVMSYDAPNQAFQNTVFDITTTNNGGASTSNNSNLIPITYGLSGGFLKLIPILKQNSFAYLSAALGNFDVNYDPYAHAVADPNSVSPDYYAARGAPSVINTAAHPLGVIGVPGEYDVYTLQKPTSRFDALGAVNQATRITLTAGSTSLDPQLLLYDAAGTTLLASVHGTSLQYTLTPGTKYQLVVSGYLGDSTGVYQINMTSVSPFANATVIDIQPTTTVPTTVFSKSLIASDFSLLG
jgi:hypothetical protein